MFQEKSTDEKIQSTQSKSKPTVEAFFESFACEMLKLDKDTYTEVPKDEKSAYVEHRYEEIQSYHDTEIKSDVLRIFSIASRSEKNKKDLSASIFAFVSSTEAQYGRVASVLKSHFGSTFTKSYVCRLFKAGEVCSKFPVLENVVDIDKLYLLSRIDDKTLASNLEPMGGDAAIMDKPINLSSRKELREHLQDCFPDIFSSPERSANESTVATSLGTFKMSLEAHQHLFNKDSELSNLVEKCIEILSQCLPVESTNQEGEQV